MIGLKEGDRAPGIDALDQKGKRVSLKDFKNKKVILYFYPKDSTPGCTAEACNLRNNYNRLTELGFIILGVSPDSAKSHQRFTEKNDLPFILIPDEKKKIINDYGVWGEKKMFGKIYMGLLRTTFIIDEKGKIEKVIKKVKTKEHVEQILEIMGL